MRITRQGAVMESSVNLETQVYITYNLSWNMNIRTYIIILQIKQGRVVNPSLKQESSNTCKVS